MSLDRMEVMRDVPLYMRGSELWRQTLLRWLKRQLPASTRTRLRWFRLEPFLILCWFSTPFGELQVPLVYARSVRHPRKRSGSNEMSGS